ncbi:MAG: DUF3500 domain-containing protein [Chitinophagaceae bacterium]
MPRSILFSLLYLASFFATGQPGYQQDIKTAANNLISTLNPVQKKMALLSFDDTARIKWNNLPVGMRARSGISIGNMTEEQRKLLHRILSVSLSSQGYLKATGIMHLDNLLNIFVDTSYYRKDINDELRKFLNDLKWTHRNYYIAFFGMPSDTNWGYKIEGHHLSVNYSFTGDKVSVTPWFIGTDPAEMPITEYAGWRVLGQEEDLGLKLIQALTPGQQKKATLSTEVPAEIITGAETGKRLVDEWGIKGSELTASQRTVLENIIHEYVFNMEFEKASEEYKKIAKAGIGNIYFGWIGPYEESKAHYFVINGPTFLIEFDNAGGPRRKGNHIHTIWREKGNEFGEDILKKHYQAEKH